MRKFKYHEKKLLKKVNLFTYKKEHNVREIQVMRRYHIQNREDYVKYNIIVGLIRKISNMLKDLPKAEKFRIEATESMLQKLYTLGIVNSRKNLLLCEDVNVSQFCRRRLPVVITRLKFTESVKEAVKLVEQGHFRIGPNIVRDAAYLVPREMEDHIQWVDSSKIKRTIMTYKDQLDDYDMIG